MNRVRSGSGGEVAAWNSFRAGGIRRTSRAVWGWVWWVMRSVWVWVWVSSLTGMGGGRVGAEDRVVLLDGRGSWVELPDRVEGDREAWTVDLWVRWDAFPYYATPLHFGDERSSFGFNHGAAEPILKAFVQAEGGEPRMVWMQPCLVVGEWVHLAATVGNGEVVLWVNGRRMGANALPAGFHGALREVSARGLGRSPWVWNGYFRGALDEVRVWGRVLADAEMAALPRVSGAGAGVGPGLVAYWSFDTAEEVGGGWVSRSAVEGTHEARLRGRARLVAGGRPMAGPSVPSWRVVARVLDVEGRPVPAEVRVVQPGRPSVVVRAGDDGRAEVRWLGRGEEGLLRFRWGRQTAERRVRELPAGGGNIEVRLERGPAFGGRLVQPDGRPNVGMRVEWRPVLPGGEAAGAGEATQTDGAGRFEFVGWPVGEYELRLVRGPDPLVLGNWLPDEVYRVRLEAGAGGEAGASGEWEAVVRGVGEETRWRRFTTRDGLPENQVGPLAGDGEGGVWMGSAAGLSRFDGVTVRTWTRRDGLPVDAVTALAVDRDGGLWVGTERGVVRRVGERFEAAPGLEGWTNGVVSLAVARDGAVWVGHLLGLIRLQDGGVRHLGTGDGLPSARVYGLWPDAERGVWAWMDEGNVCHVDGVEVTVGTPSVPESEVAEDPEVARKRWERFTWPPLEVVPGREWRRQGNRYHAWDGRRVREVPVGHRLGRPMALDGVGLGGREVWVSTGNAGLLRLGALTPINLSVDHGLPSAEVSVSLQDSRGDLWIGTSSGLAWWSGGRVRVLDRADGLPSGDVRCLHVDGEGVLWVGTEAGLARRDRERFVVVPEIPPTKVASIRAGPGGRPWVLVPGSGFWVQAAGGRFERRHVDALHPVSYASDLLPLDGGELLVASQLGLARLRDGRLVMDASMPVVPLKGPSVLAAGAGGVVWVGTPQDGLFRVRGGTWERWLPEDGLPSATIRSLAEDERGWLWVGTPSGLGLFRDGQWSVLDTADGLADASVHHVRPGAGGEVWLGTSGGLGLYRPSLTAPRVAWGELNGEPRRTAGGGMTIHSEGQTARFTVVTHGRNRVQWRVVGPGQEGVWSAVRLSSEWTWRPGRPGDYVVEARAWDRDLNVSEVLSWPVRVRRLPHRDGRLLVPLGLLAMAGATGLVWMGLGLRRQRREAMRLREEARVHAVEDRMRIAFEEGLLASVEAERGRIARELHDSLGQELLLMRNAALLARRETDSEAVVGRSLGDIADRASRTLEEVRGITYGLRPQELDRFGLVAALEALCGEMAERHGLVGETVFDPALPRLEAGLEIGVFRIVQEGLNNVVRHARATRFRCGLDRVEGGAAGEAGLRLELEDDGVGFDAVRAMAAAPTRSGGLGLAGIKERVRIFGGTLDVDAAPGRGTRLRVWLPLREAGPVEGREG